jgi:hypothetical protein
MVQATDRPFDIDPEFRALIPPLGKEELAQLEANIVQVKSCHDPLRAWQPEGGRPLLLDGHNRLEICERHGIDYDILWMHHINDRAGALLWILESQLGRRNLTDDQRAALAADLLERRAAASRKEKASKAGQTGGRGRGRDSSEVTSAPELSEARPRARAEAAKAAKVPERKVRDAAEDKKADPDLHRQVAEGKVTLRQAKKQVRTPHLPPEQRRERELKVLELFAGGMKFTAIAEQLGTTATYVSGICRRAERGLNLIDAEVLNELKKRAAPPVPSSEPPGAEEGGEESDEAAPTSTARELVVAVEAKVCDILAAAAQITETLRTKPLLKTIRKRAGEIQRIVKAHRCTQGGAS